jgi:hypothetical protein
MWLSRLGGNRAPAGGVRGGVTTPTTVGAAADATERPVPTSTAPRRRHRRVAFVAAGAVVLLVAAGALVGIRASSADPDVATADRSADRDAARPVTDAPTNRLASIAIQREADGGVNVTFTFEAPLPAALPQPIPDIDSVPRELDGVAYTTQQGGPGAVIHQCDTWHGGFSPLPLETGSVDVFFPASWAPADFDPFEDVPVYTGVRPDEDVPPGEWNGKFVGCGPHEGHFQYSVWAPPSDDLDDVSAYVTASTLVVEIRP